MGEISGALVIKVASELFEVPVTEILSGRRHTTIVRARQAAQWATLILTSKSLPEVGRIFGRDHTTVLHASRRTEDLRRADADYKRQTDDLLEATRRAAQKIAENDSRRVVDINGLKVAREVLTDPIKVTTVSVNELRSIAATLVGVSAEVKDLRTRQLKTEPEFFKAVAGVLLAGAGLQQERFGSNEKRAIDRVLDAVHRLNRFADVKPNSRVEFAPMPSTKQTTGAT